MQELIIRLRDVAERNIFVENTALYTESADLIESQAAEIASIQETLDAVTRVASDAENLVISQRDEIEKYKALCDQLIGALEEAMYSNSTQRAIDKSVAANTAWRAMK